jgi:hypothetical protein
MDKDKGPRCKLQGLDLDLLQIQGLKCKHGIFQELIQLILN